jgi:hypothetical protein
MADLYDLMKKSQLQDECKRRGLSYSKRRNDVLRDALRAHDALRMNNNDENANVNNANGNNANGNNANGNNTNNNGANNNGANNSAVNNSAVNRGVAEGAWAPGTTVVNGAVRLIYIPTYFFYT